MAKIDIVTAMIAKTTAQVTAAVRDPVEVAGGIRKPPKQAVAGMRRFARPKGEYHTSRGPD
jgi:hypothetical protein